MSNAHAVRTISTLKTDIVVDLGCCSYMRSRGVEDSIVTLIERFSPTVLFGFDPHPALQEGVGQVQGTTVITSRRAVWTHNRTIGLELCDNCTHVREDGGQQVKALDLAAWVRSLPEARMVLKVDIEGAEYVVLPYLIEAGLMNRFSRLLIEWHTGKYARGYESDRRAILAGIECPVEEWQ